MRYRVKIKIMMPISDDNGDAVASSSQQLPTSPPSNLGRPSLSSVSSLAPNWLQNGFTRHRKRSSWKFKGRGSLCFLTSVLLVLSILPLIGLCSQEEERLVRDLFRGYNKLIRPVQNMTQKVKVAFGLAFIQLINVNEKNQIMKSNVWLRLVWNDYQLQWDEADYGGISVLRLPPDKVWKPDIVLFNNADGNYEVRYKSNVLIYPDGEVLWVPPAIYQVLLTTRWL